MRRTTLRLPLVKRSKKHRILRRRLNLSKPGQWQRARDYLNGEHDRAAATMPVLWSGPLFRLLRR